jgi:ABC-type glutathione transport system ATPase component
VLHPQLPVRSDIAELYESSLAQKKENQEAIQRLLGEVRLPLAAREYP